MKHPVTDVFILSKIANSQKYGYPVAKWVTFCKALLDEGFTVQVHESLSTKSKYVYVSKGGAKPYSVRFSDHKPNHGSEMAGSCDFFVGVTNFRITNTEMALAAVRAHFRKETK